MALFGTNDKLALELFIVAVALLIGAGLGLVARRRYAIAAAAFIAFGVVGFAAVARRCRWRTRRWSRSPRPISVGVGLWVLGWLLDRSRGRRRPTVTAPHDGRHARLVATLVPHPRRRASASGRSPPGSSAGTCSRRGRTAPVGDGPAVPPASVTVPPLTPEADLSTTVAGLTPIVVPTDQFYRIDTALLTPSVVHGRLDAAHPRPGRPRDDPDLGAAHRAPDVRAVRDHRLRQQRGRRQAGRQRQVDRAFGSATCSRSPASRPRRPSWSGARSTAGRPGCRRPG